MANLKDPLENIEAPRARERASLALEIPVTKFENRVKVLILQHPQEPDKELGSAALLVRALEHAKLKVGLSWGSLSKALGEEAMPSEWAVLYLGPKGKVLNNEVNLFNRKQEPAIIRNTRIVGIVVLDGTWSQAKTLWWRNSWLLKLNRVVLKPESQSLYGRLRKEPRADAVSTIESVALALGGIDPKKEMIQQHLMGAFKAMLDEFKARKRKPL